MGRGSDAISYSQRGNKRGLIFRAGSRQESHLTEAAEAARRKAAASSIRSGGEEVRIPSHILPGGVMQMRARGGRGGGV